MLKSFDITIGVLSYLRTDLLLQTIDCIKDTTFNVDVIILNNNDFCIKSDLDSIQGIPENVNINYVFCGENLGVSKGRAKIVELCTTEYLILLDDDIYLENIDVIIENTLLNFEREPLLALQAFNIKEYSTGKHNKFEIPHKNKKIDLSKDFYTYIIIGAGNALRKSVVQEVGNFPKDFGLYGFEEIDLSFRVLNAGYVIKYLSKNIIFHKKSPDGRFSNDKVLSLYLINRSKMAKRYFPSYFFVSCVLVRSCHYIIKTRNFKGLFFALGEIFNDKKVSKFNNEFYKYVSKVNGFLWY